MFEEIIKISGPKDGPTSIILVGVHGNEKCGIEALNKILPNLKIECGTVFIGYGNPRAIETNKRFIDANLNRMFNLDSRLTDEAKNSYEYSRAQFLKKYLDQSEVLLDIHASNTPTSKPFIICERNAIDIIKYLPINLIVSGFDELEPGGTDCYMNSVGKIGVCIECGFLGDSSSVDIAEKSIYVFLKSRNHIVNNLISVKHSYINMNYLYKTKTNKFILKKQFDDFEKIKKDEIIGLDGEEVIKAAKDSFILFARNREKIGDEGFLLGESVDEL